MLLPSLLGRFEGSAFRSVCLSVCLSVCPGAYLKRYWSDWLDFFLQEKQFVYSWLRPTLRWSGSGSGYGLTNLLKYSSPLWVKSKNDIKICHYVKSELWWGERCIIASEGLPAVSHCYEAPPCFIFVCSVHLRQLDEFHRLFELALPEVLKGSCSPRSPSKVKDMYQIFRQQQRGQFIYTTKGGLSSSCEEFLAV